MHGELMLYTCMPWFFSGELNITVSSACMIIAPVTWNDSLTAVLSVDKVSK